MIAGKPAAGKENLQMQRFAELELFIVRLVLLISLAFQLGEFLWAQIHHALH